MSKFLQFWCKLNTCRNVKTCPFSFLRDYYGDYGDSFPTVSYGVSGCFP